MSGPKKVVVLGAGASIRLCAPVKSFKCFIHFRCIGLTTALKIQERDGYQVTIVAESLPGDVKSIKYTSHWAVSDVSF